MPLQSLKCLMINESNVQKNYVKVSVNASLKYTPLLKELKMFEEAEKRLMIQRTSCVRHVGNNVMTSTCVE